MALHPGEAGYEEKGYRKSDLDESHTLWDGDVERKLGIQRQEQQRAQILSATEQLELKRKEEALQKEQKAVEFANQVNDLDWKKLPPPLMAQILRKIPRKAKVGEPAYYLTLEQALVFALRCYELDLSPLSTDVFFMQDTWAVGITTSGKRKMARKDGLNLGAPQFKRLTRPFPTGKTKTFGLSEDVGYECRMSVNGDNDHPSMYTCWASEWAVLTSAIWRDKLEHMLQIRAMSQCISFASGSGVSDMPDEREIESESQVKTVDVGVVGVI